MKFKVGDRVRYTGPLLLNYVDEVQNPPQDVQVHHQGVVTEVIELKGIHWPYEVQFDNLTVMWPMDEDELELAE